MQIIQLQAENVKALTAVEITPDGKPVILTGSNGSGKSSCLDAIYWALTNDGLEDPIRHGATKAKVHLNLGEVTIERKATRNGTTLIVTTAAGGKINSPQAFLDGINGELTMDPLAFTRLKPAEQRDMLLRAAGVNVEDLDEQYKSVYDERTMANRLAAAAQSKWQALPDAPAGTPEKEQVGTELEAEKAKLDEQATAHQNDLNSQSSAKTVVSNAQQVVDQRNARVKELQTQLDNAKTDLDEAEDELAAAKGQLNDFAEKIRSAPDATRLTEIKTKLASLSTTNAAVRTKQSKSAAKSEAAKAQLEAAALDTKLTGIADAKIARLASAKFGVPGLTVSDDGVSVGGIPFAQKSTAEQVEIGMLIAMKQNPKLKIIMIREGAMIGKAITASIFSLAAKHGYQLWVERMQDNAGTVGVHIEQGHIVAVDGQPLVMAEEEAFAGYVALPDSSHKKHWTKSFGISRDYANAATTDHIEQMWRDLVKRNHPEVAGDPQRMAEINAAYDEFKLERGI